MQKKQEAENGGKEHTIITRSQTENGEFLPVQSLWKVFVVSNSLPPFKSQTLKRYTLFSDKNVCIELTIESLCDVILFGNSCTFFETNYNVFAIDNNVHSSRILIQSNPKVPLNGFVKNLLLSYNFFGQNQALKISRKFDQACENERDHVLRIQSATLWFCIALASIPATDRTHATKCLYIIELYCSYKCLYLILIVSNLCSKQMVLYNSSILMHDDRRHF